MQGNRWWLHLYRLLDGKFTWEADEDQNPLLKAPTAEGHEAEEFHTRVLSVPDWPVAKESCADWVWHGLVAENQESRKQEASKAGLSGFDAPALAHVRGEGMDLNDVHDVFVGLS